MPRQKRTVSRPNAKALRKKPASQAPASATRAIVAVDEDTLRAKADALRRKYLKQLESAQGSLQRFEEGDLPSFEQWRAAEFGKRLTELREMQAEMREIGSLVDEVEEEYFYSGKSYRECYAHVKRMREHPEEYQSHEYDDPSDDTAGFDADADSDEREFMKEFAEMLGIDVDSPEFKAHMDRFHARGEFGAEAASHQSARVARTPEQSGMKTAYRSLARKLHPDHREELEAIDAKRLDELWHEAQEAYSHGDLESLQRIDALIDIEANGVTQQTDIERIEQVAERHRQSLRAIERSIRQARKHPAWMFSKKPNLKIRLKLQIERELAQLIAHTSDQIAYFRDRIARWSKPRRSRAKKAAPKKASIPTASPKNSGRVPDSKIEPENPSSAENQMDFSF